MYRYELLESQEKDLSPSGNIREEVWRQASLLPTSPGIGPRAEHASSLQSEFGGGVVAEEERSRMYLRTYRGTGGGSGA